MWNAIQVLARFRFELRHPVQPADRCEALHDPAGLGMLAHVRLHEKFAVAQIQPGGQVDCRELAGAVMQLFRVDGQGDGVQIDDTEDVVVLRLGLRPVAQRAQVVAQVQVACRLDAGKDPFLHGRVRGGHGRFWLDIVVHIDGHLEYLLT